MKNKLYPKRNCLLVVASCRFLSFILGFIVLTTSVYSQSTTPLSFSIIPTSDPDLIAPGRGAEHWNDVPWDNSQGLRLPTASNIHVLDAYYRFNWFDFETPQQGVYNWSLFDVKINAAINAGKKFSFGVMPMCEGCQPTVDGAGMGYPQYLHAQMQSEPVNSRDWLYQGQWIPNWNS